MNSSKNNIRLAKEFPLPGNEKNILKIFKFPLKKTRYFKFLERRLLGTWEIRRNMGSTKKMMKLPIEETQIYFNDLQQVTQKQGKLCFFQIQMKK